MVLVMTLVKNGIVQQKKNFPEKFWESLKIESWLFQTKNWSIFIHIETLLKIALKMGTLLKSVFDMNWQFS